MSQKSLNVLSWIIKGGLLISPVLSFLVSNVLFFPFITSKNFFFRAMVEILLLLWVFLAAFDKNYRPKKSPLLFALLALLAVLTLATILGENPYRSFWSNFERMEGLIGYIHLFLYFLILSTVFKKETDFKWLFASLLAVSAIITGYAYLQFLGKITVHQGGMKLDATLGNSTYLAIYIIFHLFLVSLLWFKTRNLWIRGILMFLFFVELPIVYYTTTRGAILGFLGGVIIFTVLMTIFTKNKKIRYSFFSAFVLLLVLIGSFIVLRQSHFVQNSPVLSKLAAISFKERTVESRFTIWKMGFEGFKEHPILGWGPENFNLVFNKYYKANMWKQEPWFDRAHNIIFDWVISAGIIGFAAYWSIFIVSLYMIWRGGGGGSATSSRGRASSIEAVLFTSLFAAYSFHNLFVFDNLTSYYLFFTILAYVHYRHQSDINRTSDPLRERSEASIGHKIPEEKLQATSYKLQANDIGIGHYLIITSVFILVVFSLYFVNLKPYLAAKHLIFALQKAASGTDTDKVLSEFNKVFSYRTFGTIEAREQLSSFASNVYNAQISQDKKNRVFSEAIKEMEEQVKITPNDLRYHLFLGSLYEKAGRNNDALNSFIKAVELSPKKQQVYFGLAEAYLSLGKTEKAFEVLKTAYDLDNTNPEAVKNLAIIMVLNKQEKEAETLIEKQFGAKVITDKQLLNSYARNGNFKMVKDMWLEIIKKEPDSAQNYVALAATYLQLKERENSVKALEKAIELDPKFKEQGEFYIKEIKAGKNP